MQVGPALSLKIPITGLKLAHNLGPPCECQVPARREWAYLDADDTTLVTADSEAAARSGVGAVIEGVARGCPPVHAGCKGFTQTALHPPPCGLSEMLPTTQPPAAVCDLPLVHG